MNSFRTLLIICLTLSFFNCSEKIADNPTVNKQPKSFVWLYPDTTIGTGISRQHLHWWGEDPDGLVRGYLFGFVKVRLSQSPSPDTVRYTWVTKNDTLIQLPHDTLFRYYTVFVRAVDNTFPGLSEKSSVRLTPNPYLDRNANGVFDGSDSVLTTLTAAMDPVGAMLVLPIRNSPPTIEFASNPNDPGNALRLPDYTYTCVSISFKGYDPDGEGTLASYRIALNDTSVASNWLTLRLRDTIVTLVVPRSRSDAAPNIPGTPVAADVYSGKFRGGQSVGQLPGLRLDTTNVIYVQARDVAGEYSPALRLPSAGQTAWRVKRPRGKLLLVNDYTRNDAGAALTTYLTTLHQIPDPQFAVIDTLNLALGVTVVDKQAGRLSRMVPPFIDPTLVYTFLLYDYVFLYTDESPSLAVLQSVPFLYLQNGGKLLLSTVFSADFSIFNATSVLREFAPIDSISSVNLGPTRPPAPPPVPGDTRIPGGYTLHPDSSVATNIYPKLAFNGTASTIHLIFMRDMYRRVDGRVIYRLQPDVGRNRYNARDPGGSDTLRPKVAIVDGQRTMVFFGLPLHLLNNTDGGNQGLVPLFTKMFTQQFSPIQRVNRRRF
ncbi:MAG: hypothetical protein HY961_19445 [Ignavibacteriae bacterium]|nr:hypothetical protein [Ignavibacteriota bacterium]